jgi:hypothetical protein
MGRKAGVMHVNPKSLMRKTMTCMQEILVFLACIQKFNYDDDKCAAEKRALNMCMELQVILSFRNAVQFSRSRACAVVERIRVLRSLEALESMQCQQEVWTGILRKSLVVKSFVSWSMNCLVEFRILNF